MCITCGCSDDATPTFTHLHGQSSTNPHSHQHIQPDGTVITHTHAPEPTPAAVHAQHHGTTITLEQHLLSKNDAIAAQNRGWLRGRESIAFNLVSSPGAGKTTLLVRTLQDLQGDRPMVVIEGDQATTHDAERIQGTGCPAIQVNTGTGCHLDAGMIQRGLDTLRPPLGALVWIENVGNLVCPALFDLGETAKVVILSVTEGEDKPIKYPHMFRASQVMVLTKIDLLPYVSFDVDRCLDYARQVNPHLKIFQVSATTGAGLDDWYGWLREQS
jgi:hydrogenase nickel incorporation protein HypB